MFMQPASGSLPPIGTGQQLPRWLATLHDMQLPQAAAVLSQQYPSVQLPLKHSAPAAHIVPLAFRLVQTFDMQV